MKRPKRDPVVGPSTISYLISPIAGNSWYYYLKARSVSRSRRGVFRKRMSPAKERRHHRGYGVSLPER